MVDTSAPDPSDSMPEERSSVVWLLLGGAVLGGIMALLTAGGGLLASGGVRSVGQAPRLPTPIPDRVRVGEPAPDFTSTTPDGEPISLVDYRGSIVALNFWATWCAPCRVEMPVLQEAAESFGDGQLAILAVNAGESPEVIQAFMDELDLTFPAVLDEDLKIVELYGVRAFPTTVWIDAEGIVRAEHFGPLSRDQIEDYIEQLTP